VTVELLRSAKRASGNGEGVLPSHLLNSHGILQHPNFRWVIGINGNWLLKNPQKLCFPGDFTAMNFSGADCHLFETDCLKGIFWIFLKANWISQQGP